MESINTSRLEIGMEIKNYKELCKLIDEPLKGGASKRAQVKAFSDFFEYEKQGIKFKIKNIIKHTEKIDLKIKRGERTTSVLQLEDAKLKYLILDQNIDLEKVSLWCNDIIKWKCSSCGNIFEKPVVKITNANYVKCEMCSQSKDSAKIQKTLDYFNIKYKKEYKFNDLKGINGERSLRFDFALFKSKKLLSILEYDGGYHDFKEVTIENDQLKNEYCLKNKIPLFRIHHTHDLMNCLLDYLIEYKFINTKQKKEYLKFIKINNIKNKISRLKEEQLKLQLELKELINEY